MATCRGIDVSAYQGTQDWAARKAEGVVFAFAKASEGQTSRDPKFASHIRGIISAGLVPGAYHFAWPVQDPVREADNYIAAVKAYAKPGFVHWLDLERYSDGRNYAGKSSAQIAVWVTTWLARVRTAFPGQRVGVYTSADDIAKGHVPLGVPLWYPAYPWGPAAYSRAEAAAQPKPSGRAPLMWQFTSQPVDRNIAYMSAADLRAWAQGTDIEEDPMALTADDLEKIRKAVWESDKAAAPADAPDVKTNPTWQYQSYLKDTNARVRAIQGAEAAQTAAITALAKLVGSNVDTAAVVAAVQQAIADAVVKVSVDVTGPQG
ncbi:glycoside hydrolase family 25 protein [Streptomyces sp. NPDC001177]